MSPSGTNWRAFSTVALVITIGVGAYACAPMARCVFVGMDEAKLQGLSEDDEFRTQVYGRDSTDVGRVQATDGFLGAFFGGIPRCARAEPPGNSAPWTIPVAGLAALLFGLFRFLDREQFKKQVKTLSASHVAVREAYRTGAPKTVAARDTASRPRVLELDEPSGSGSRPAVARASDSGPTIRSTGNNPAVRPTGPQMSVRTSGSQPTARTGQDSGATRNLASGSSPTVLPKRNDQG